MRNTDLSEKERRAVDDLAAILCEKPAEPSMLLEEIPPKQIARKNLGLFNAAISALGTLIDVIDDYQVETETNELLDKLRQVRINQFEHLVPWEALAKGDAIE